MLTDDQVDEITKRLHVRHGETGDHGWRHVEVIAHEYAHILAMRRKIDMQQFKTARFSWLQGQVQNEICSFTKPNQDHNELVTNAVVYVALHNWLPDFDLQEVIQNAVGNLSVRIPYYLGMTKIMQLSEQPRVQAKALVLRQLLLED